jgi:hypothetical protein
VIDSGLNDQELFTIYQKTRYKQIQQKQAMTTTTTTEIDKTFQSKAVSFGDLS